VPSEHYFAIGKYQQMIFCTPKEKVTHRVKEILNDGDGDKNSGDGDTFCGDGDTAGGDRAGMGANPVWKGWGWGQRGRLGMGTNSCPRAAL